MAIKDGLRIVTDLERRSFSLDVVDESPKDDDKGLSPKTLRTVSKALVELTCSSPRRSSIPVLGGATGLVKRSRGISRGECDLNVLRPDLRKIILEVKGRHIDRLSFGMKSADEILEAAKYTPHLLRADFRNALDVTDEVLQFFFQSCSCIKNLNLSGCEKVTFETINFDEVPLLSWLQEVDFSCCSSLTDKGLHSFFQNSPNITHAKLERCRLITGDCFSYQEEFSLLKELDLSNCSSLTSAGLLKLLRVCTNLTTVILSGCELISEYDLQEIHDQYPLLYVETKVLACKLG